MTKITAPAAVPGEHVGVGGLVFTDGVAETDNPAIIEYAQRHGYGVGNKKPTTIEAEEEQPDSRDIHANGPEVVGGPLRDAAVDPRPDDYLPPTNAGKADPHGPLVVAPGLHAVPPSPIVPGAVTEEKEISAATQALVEGKDIGEVTAHHSGDDTGPLDLSDPSSGEFADSGVADSPGAVKPDLKGEPPAANATHDAWVKYATRNGMAKADAQKMSRNELRDKYSG